MGRCPHAKWKPLGPITDEPRLRHKNKAVVHTIVGTLRSADNYFRQGGFSGTESHFGIGDGWDDLPDGKAFQWQDTDYQADAQLEGNDDCVSIETADHYPDGQYWEDGSDVPPWTPKQIDKLVDILVWVCRRYDIPPVLIERTEDWRRGITYHRAGVDPWRKPGCEKYSTSYGKVCPGNRRIRQLRNIVIPRVRARLNGDDMPTPMQIWNAELNVVNDPDNKPDPMPAKVMLMETHHRALGARRGAYQALTAAQNAHQDAQIARREAHEASVRAQRAVRLLEDGGSRTGDPGAATAAADEAAPGSTSPAPVTTLVDDGRAKPAGHGKRRRAGSMRPREYRKATGGSLVAALVGLVAAVYDGGAWSVPSDADVTAVIAAAAATFGTVFGVTNRDDTDDDA